MSGTSKSVTLHVLVNDPADGIARNAARDTWLWARPSMDC
jgi:hypothetical protein